MRLALLGSLAVLVAAPSVGAAAAPTLSAKDRQAIGSLVDRFVKGAVERHDLAGAWALAGPGLRGGTSRKAWVAGTGVTVETYPARGNDFSHAWTADVVEPGKVGISLMLHPAPGHRGVAQTAFRAQLVKRHGRWLVDSFYPAAQFFGGGHVVGPNDFAPGANTVATTTKARIRALWLVVAGAAIAALIVLIPAGFWVRAKRRERRAYAAYLATRH
jgi:hypothetical protein